MALPLFGIEMKTDFFQSCGHYWVFQICWHIECSTFTASSFRTWNSSTRIPSPPLAFFVVMLPKAHLTSHSRMVGSRWVRVITPSWLSGSWRSFLYSSSVYSCHLFLIMDDVYFYVPAILLLSLHTSFQVIILQEQFFSIPILQIKKMTFTNVDRMVKVGLP